MILLYMLYQLTFETKYSRRRSKDRRILPVILCNEERILIATTIVEIANKHQLKIFATAILPDHVHIVIDYRKEEISRLINIIKGYTSFVLNRALKGTVQGNGRQRVLWAGGYNQSFITFKLITKSTKINGENQDLLNSITF
jgi:REP element-mobilizing transposase RayT